MVGPMNITEFKYRYKSAKQEALVLYRQALLNPAPISCYLMFASIMVYFTYLLLSVFSMDCSKSSIC
ncbi:hypothetical protein BVRB_7g161070 [Beta vulgaris subsp. vulgaris]|nr:hypothetical protein BVRB_7g161070 [Beta vulgaris subsp. vulgaris]